jgi:glyoxylase-like metal-dependent hydrolase (beta-lactamase superfamily II)
MTLGLVKQIVPCFMCRKCIYKYKLRILKGFLIPLSVLMVQCSDSEKITESLSLVHGSVNGVTIERNGKRLIIYGDPDNGIRNADMVLFTHFRRDVAYAGVRLIQNGAKAVVPAGEKQYFTGCDSIWKEFSKSRFHDYYCQTTKILSSPVNVSGVARGGDVIAWEDLKIDVLSTPGFTRGAVAYLVEIDGKKVAFSGDLIYGNGQIFDLYSLQDSYESIGGYHGYATRLGNIISSLQLVAEQKPDIIIPSRGPVIYDPVQAIDSLVTRVRELYRNYLSVSAYRWYFPDRMKLLADHVLGPDSKSEWMPYASVIRKDPPAWYMHIDNSNLVVADDSSAFLIDCGTTDALEGIRNLSKSGRIKRIEGIFVTHYHDDHTEFINDIVEEYKCPVYVTAELKDILENPGSYQMPCLTTKTIKNIKVVSEKQQMTWKDFTLTFYYFPGQTIYHDAVIFNKSAGESIFFIGDSFTPSGIDDYCLLNRNLLHEGTGYFYCLDLLKAIPEGILLANQHVEPLFAYSHEQIDFMTTKLKERNKLFRELFPWGDINYGIDEQWAKVYPYGQIAGKGTTAELSVRLSNHTSVEKRFIVEPHSEDIRVIRPGRASVSVAPGKEGILKFRANIPNRAKPGVKVVTFDVDFDNKSFKEWCEAIITVEER